MKKHRCLQFLLLFISCFLFWEFSVANITSQSLPSLRANLEREGPFYSGESVIVEVTIDPGGEEVYAADIYFQLTESGILGTDKVRVDSVQSAAPGFILGPFNAEGDFDEVRVVDEANRIGQVRVHVTGAQVIGEDLVASPIRTPTVVFTASLVVTDSSEWEQEIETFDLVEVELEFGEANSHLLDSALQELSFRAEGDFLQIYPPVAATITPRLTPTPTVVEPTPTPVEGVPFWIPFGALPAGTIDCNAQIYPDCSDGCVQVAIFRSCLNLNLFLQIAVSWVTLLAGIFTLLRLGIGFLGVATAGGDVKKLEEARYNINFAVLGLIIVASAWLVLRTMNLIIPSVWEVWFGV